MLYPGDVPLDNNHLCRSPGYSRSRSQESYVEYLAFQYTLFVMMSKFADCRCKSGPFTNSNNTVNCACLLQHSPVASVILVQCQSYMSTFVFLKNIIIGGTVSQLG